VVDQELLSIDLALDLAMLVPSAADVIDLRRVAADLIKQVVEGNAGSPNASLPNARK
jgi:hypothetical protein